MKTRLFFLLALLWAVPTFAQHTITLSPVEDAYITAYGGGEGKNTFFKFDISSVPADMVIFNTYLTAWVYRQSLNWDGDMRYIFFNNQTWTEADSTQEIWINLYFTDTIEQPPMNFGMVNGFSQSIDLTSFFLYNYQVSDQYFSFRMKDPDDGTMFPMMNIPMFNNPDSLLAGNIFNDNCAFRPSEYSNPNQRPILTVVYYIPPDITAFNGNSSVCEGDALTISVTALGDAPMSYTWFKDGVQLPGSGNTLTIDPTTLADSGAYFVVASNPWGSDTSSTINIDIIPQPIVDLGNDTTICESTTITLDAGPGFDSYQWSDFSTGSTLLVDNPGVGVYSYWVMVTEQGCMGGDTIQITEVVCPGIEENKFSEVQLWPNPVSSMLNLWLPDLPAQIDIYNSSGVLMLKKHFADSHTVLFEMSQWPGGIYCMHLQTNDHTFSINFVVE